MNFFTENFTGHKNWRDLKFWKIPQKHVQNTLKTWKIHADFSPIFTKNWSKMERPAYWIRIWSKLALKMAYTGKSSPSRPDFSGIPELDPIGSKWPLFVQRNKKGPKEVPTPERFENPGFPGSPDPPLPRENQRKIRRIFSEKPKNYNFAATAAKLEKTFVTCSIFWISDRSVKIDHF